MKKTLGIMSVLALAGVAHAEVNVAGYVDAGYDWQKDGGTANAFLYREGGVWLSGNSGATSFLLDLGVRGTAATATMEQGYVSHKFDNGFSWSLGKFDSIIGMESNDSVNNKFVHTGVLSDLIGDYAGAYHTGLLFGYDLSDALALNLVVANGTGDASTTDIGFKVGTKMDGLNAYVAGLFTNAAGETGYTVDFGATTAVSGLDLGAELVLVKPAAANAESGLGFGVEAGTEVAAATKLNAGFEWTNENAGDHMEFRVGPNHALSEALNLKLDYTFGKTGEADAEHGIALAGVYKF